MAFAISILPTYASAFWPFGTNAGAAVSASIPNGTTPALVAATNSDPNPHKGLGESLQVSGEALLAFSGPSGTIADVANSTPPGRISVYVVREGDTLSEIATMFNVSMNTVIWANDLSGARDVHPGDTLIILPVSGLEHKIAKGDTLKSLAKKYSGDANEIAQFNGLDEGAPLAVGTTIIIPGGEIVTPAATRKTVAPTRTAILGGGGAAANGYYSNPVPGGLFTQGIHGWNGIDIGAPRGTPVYAAANGTVLIARNNGAWNGGYGNYVVITHSNGSQTLYSHMRSTVAFPGQSVSSGQLLGYVGATGRATGPHLHFEVRGAANPFRHCRAGTICAPQ